ncbi:uncharacterized protein SCHCODRAFT_02537128, partial [Schizophyllum commune H4-8]|uniref:uncharacterized protein n=1 Tax=Schizophyllum commune (strain H4-8 / FGSC 9210) TaxID=578458 RepID=UPI00215F82C7
MRCRSVHTLLTYIPTDNPDASPLPMHSFLLGYNTRTHKTDPYGPTYLHKPPYIFTFRSAALLS